MNRQSPLVVTLALGILLAPLSVDAQQPGRVYRIGFLMIESRERLVPYRNAFHEGLRELGYVEGRDFVSEDRYADRQLERLPGLAAELVRLKVDVIVTGSNPGTRAAKQATTTIPIVMMLATDPEEMGLIASLRRPGGNVTGLTITGETKYGKRLQLLKEVVPRASHMAVLWNPDLPENAPRWKAVEEAAGMLGVTLLSAEVREPREIESAFTRIKRERAEAVLVIADTLALSPLRVEIPALAAKNRLPAMYTFREEVNRGGLMSYGENVLDLFRRAAVYVDKILKGAKPGELPVERPMRYELIINLKAAKALGLTIPPSVLIRADKLIE